MTGDREVIRTIARKWLDSARHDAKQARLEAEEARAESADALSQMIARWVQIRADVADLLVSRYEFELARLEDEQRIGDANSAISQQASGK